MGTASSAQEQSLTREEIEELRALTPFSAKTLKRLWHRFQHLDKAGVGVIRLEDFKAIPELSMNPLLNRIVSLFGAETNDEITFRQFVVTLAVFSPKTEIAKKIEFAFRLYDVHGDGYITSDDVLEVLKLMVGDNLPEAQLRNIADQTIAASDLTGDNRLSLQEFESSMRALPNFSETILTINF